MPKIYEVVCRCCNSHFKSDIGTTKKEFRRWVAIEGWTKRKGEWFCSTCKNCAKEIYGNTSKLH